MKVLFKIDDYCDIATVSINDAIQELDAFSESPCVEYDSGEKDFLEMRLDGLLVSLGENSAVKKLAGAYLSNAVANLMYNEDEGRVNGFAGDDVDVRAIATEEYIFGCQNPAKLKEFATKLRTYAKDDARGILKRAGFIGKTIDEEMLDSSENIMTSVSQAFTIMANEPTTTMYAGYYADWDIGSFLKCWPSEEELQKIMENPELYAVAEVVFK